MIIRKLTLLAALLIPGAGFADWPADARRSEEWPLPPKVRAEDVAGVVYGAKDAGYFRLPAAAIRDGKVRSEIFPPAYHTAIEYKLLLKNGREVPLGKKKYASPFADAFISLKPIREGVFSEPYFFAFAYPKDGANALPVVLNRAGEIVWATRPKIDGKPLIGVLGQKTNSSYILVGQGANSGVQIVNAISGEVERELAAPHLSLHHTFEYNPESGEVLGLSYTCRTLSAFEDDLPLFQGVGGWLNRALLPRRTYASADLVRMNLYTGNVDTLWNTTDSFSVTRSPNLSLGFYADIFAGLTGRRQYKRATRRDLYKGTWGFECNSDWAHENAIRHYPGQGYLLSQRNTNRILMLDEQRRLKWSVGNSPSDTYRIQDIPDQLGMQHDPRLLEDGRILVFDNQTRWRGYEGGVRPNAVKILRLGEDGIASVDWKFELPNPASEFRGSAEYLPNGHLIVYQSGGGEDMSRVYEIDPQNKSVVARLQLAYKGNARPIEWRVQDAIADEVYLRPATAGAGLRPLAVHNRLPPIKAGAEFASEGY